MDNQAECFSTCLIDGDSIFNADGLAKFVKEVKLEERVLSYVVVAIMGPQSSGKSTLINDLFHTNFKEMDSTKRRSQTTKGIWIARCAGLEPCTLVMDIEGTDGRERGEDDTAFEKRSTLFAIVVSDIVLINIWCTDIGREQAANKPLLRTVFRVMLQSNFRTFKKTLMFVVRDNISTTFENLSADLREDIEKIWDSVPKSKADTDTRLHDLFNVEVVALSHYVLQKDKFKEEVDDLRKKFFQSIAPGGLAGDRKDVVPASGFSTNAQGIWKLIKENKDLDLRAHRVMVAVERCQVIAKEKYTSFNTEDKDWLDLQVVVKTCIVENFREKLRSMICKCLSSYDDEATYYEASVASKQRKQLEEDLLQLVQPAFRSTLECIGNELLEKFKEEFSVSMIGGQGFAVVARDYTKKFMRLFDEGCEGAVIKEANWDSVKIERDNFSLRLNSHVTEVLTLELSKLTSIHESNLEKALYGPAKDLLEDGNDDTWPALRKLLECETETAVPKLSSALLIFELDEQNKEDLISKLKNYARGVVEQAARKVAKEVLYHMKKRFKVKFNNDGHQPRIWSITDDFQAIAKTARSSSLKFLSVLAAIRLDDVTDTICDTLVHNLLESKPPISLPPRQWKEDPAIKTIIDPYDCYELWSQFQNEIKYTITEVQTVELAKLTSIHESSLQEALSDPAERFLEDANDHTWPASRKLLKRETKKAVTKFSSALLSFELDEQNKEDLISNLKNYARGVVEQVAREVAKEVLYHMVERFKVEFNDGDKPRKWAIMDDIPAIAKTAKSSSLKVLSVLAAIRLDNVNDTIWEILADSLLTPNVLKLRPPNSWSELPATQTLITQDQCWSLWRKFQVEIQNTINQAINVRAKKINTMKTIFVVTVNGVAVLCGVVATVMTTPIVLGAGVPVFLSSLIAEGPLIEIVSGCVSASLAACISGAIALPSGKVSFPSELDPTSFTTPSELDPTSLSELTTPSDL